jgi:outer membrane protein TolC
VSNREGAGRRLAAANARIGVAEADLDLHFSLTGLVGLESLKAGSFFNPLSCDSSIGPSIK